MCPLGYHYLFFSRDALSMNNWLYSCRHEFKYCIIFLLVVSIMCMHNQQTPDTNSALIETTMFYYKNQLILVVHGKYSDWIGTTWSVLHCMKLFKIFNWNSPQYFLDELSSDCQEINQVLNVCMCVNWCVSKPVFDSMVSLLESGSHVLNLHYSLIPSIPLYLIFYVIPTSSSVGVICHIFLPLVLLNTNFFALFKPIWMNLKIPQFLLQNIS